HTFTDHRGAALTIDVGNVLGMPLGCHFLPGRCVIQGPEFFAAPEIGPDQFRVAIAVARLRNWKLIHRGPEETPRFQVGIGLLGQRMFLNGHRAGVDGLGPWLTVRGLRRLKQLGGITRGLKPERDLAEEAAPDEFPTVKTGRALTGRTADAYVIA